MAKFQGYVRITCDRMFKSNKKELKISKKRTYNRMPTFRNLKRKTEKIVWKNRIKQNR